MKRRSFNVLKRSSLGLYYNAGYTLSLWYGISSDLNVISIPRAILEYRYWYNFNNLNLKSFVASQ